MHNTHTQTCSYRAAHLSLLSRAAPKPGVSTTVSLNLIPFSSMAAVFLVMDMV